jgi:hypothetical protein
MYTVFYGGIAQYFYDNGTLTQDNNVPFVKTIGVVEKKNGTYSEHYLSNQLPGYLGAGAEFMPNLELARNGEILITDSIGTDTTLIGYIFGGISSPAANVFYNGQTNTSIATPNIYKVSLARFTGIGVEEALTDDDLGLAIKPYTDQRSLLVQISGFMDGETNFAITDTSGRLTYETFVPTKLGRNTIELGDFNAARGTYVLTATQGGKSQRIKFVW